MRGTGRRGINIPYKLEIDRERRRNMDGGDVLVISPHVYSVERRQAAPRSTWDEPSEVDCPLSWDLLVARWWPTEVICGLKPPPSKDKE
jgi:hypothetical protein